MSVSRETLLPGWADVSRETYGRLEVYATLLTRWNAKINLVSRGDEGRVWSRHIADALQLVALMPDGLLLSVGLGSQHAGEAPDDAKKTAWAIDLGSGGGFPGLVLAIATSVPFHLIEADQRKAAFLREVIRETGAPAMVHACRIEEADIGTAPLVTARALAPLSALLPLAVRFMTENAVALFPKGAAVEQELTAAAGAWNMRIERHASRIDRSGVILRISEVKRV